MTHQDDGQNHLIDHLVRNYVERRVKEIDSSALVERILDDHAQPRPAVAEPSIGQPIDRLKSNWRWMKLVSWCGISTLAVVFGFLYGRHFDNRTANASLILRDVQSEHAQETDYCYRVRFDPDPRYWNRNNKLDGPSLSHLWTRGDRFWSDCTIGDIKFKLGREANGTVWISPSRNKGIRFSNSPSRLPKVVEQICLINSMSVPRLLNEVLVDFDLNSQTVSSPTEEQRTLIWAHLKPNRTHSLLSHALLEIDPRTKVLIRLVLWTVQDGHPKGTVAFTLLEKAMITDDQYKLRFHVDSDAVIEIQALPAPDYELDLAEPSEST